MGGVNVPVPTADTKAAIATSDNDLDKVAQTGDIKKVVTPEDQTEPKGDKSDDKPTEQVGSKDNGQEIPDHCLFIAE